METNEDINFSQPSFDDQDFDEAIGSIEFLALANQESDDELLFPCQENNPTSSDVLPANPFPSDADEPTFSSPTSEDEPTSPFDLGISEPEKESSSFGGQAISSKDSINLEESEKRNRKQVGYTSANLSPSLFQYSYNFPNYFYNNGILPYYRGTFASYYKNNDFEKFIEYLNQQISGEKKIRFKKEKLHCLYFQFQKKFNWPPLTRDDKRNKEKVFWKLYLQKQLVCACISKYPQVYLREVLLTP